MGWEGGMARIGSIVDGEILAQLSLCLLVGEDEAAEDVHDMFVVVSQVELEQQRVETQKVNLPTPQEGLGVVMASGVRGEGRTGKDDGEGERQVAGCTQACFGSGVHAPICRTVLLYMFPSE